MMASFLSLNQFFISFVAIKTNFIFTFYYMCHSYVFSLVLKTQGCHFIFHITDFLIVPNSSEDFGPCKMAYRSWDQHAFYWSLLGLKHELSKISLMEHQLWALYFHIPNSWCTHGESHITKLEEIFKNHLVPTICAISLCNSSQLPLNHASKFSCFVDLSSEIALECCQPIGNFSFLSHSISQQH